MPILVGCIAPEQETFWPLVFGFWYLVFNDLNFSVADSSRFFVPFRVGSCVVLNETSSVMIHKTTRTNTNCFGAPFSPLPLTPFSRRPS